MADFPHLPEKTDRGFNKSQIKCRVCSLIKVASNERELIKSVKNECYSSQHKLRTIQRMTLKQGCQTQFTWGPLETESG